MASVTIASPYVNTSSINPRDDSFSSYLTLVKESFSLEASHPGRTHSSFKITSSRRCTNDGEIDIFDAEKYFNGTMEYKTDTLPDKEENVPCKNDNKSSSQLRSRKSASACSESSTTTGNSRTGLLRQHSIAAKAEGNKLLRVLLCNCSGKKAIETEVDVASTRDSFEPFGDRSVVDEIRLASEMMRLKRVQLGFTDDLFNGAKNLKGIEGKEIFQRELREGEKKVSAGTKDSINLPLSKIQLTSVNVVCTGGTDNTYNRGYIEGCDNYDDDKDDITSESSSDLFEINSISIQHPFFDPVMDESAVYEPSEASIDWSVVTASAANFSSVASEFEEPRKKSRKGSRKGLLTGCVSHKAVNVTTDSHQNKLTKRTDTSKMPSMSVKMGHEGLVAPAMRYQIESLKKTESRSAPPQRQHVMPATRPLTRIQARQQVYV